MSSLFPSIYEKIHISSRLYTTRLALLPLLVRLHFFPYLVAKHLLRRIEVFEHCLGPLENLGPNPRLLLRTAVSCLVPPIAELLLPSLPLRHPRKQSQSISLTTRAPPSGRRTSHSRLSQRTVKPKSWKCDTRYLQCSNPISPKLGQKERLINPPKSSAKKLKDR